MQGTIAPGEALVRRFQNMERRFIFDPTLVLYLPLYNLDGASFMSKDAYGHLCTVTGAIWRPDGRYLDGLDDKLDLGSDFIGTTALTIMAWIYPEGWGGLNYGRVLDNGKTRFMLRNNTSQQTLAFNSDGSTWTEAATGAISLDAWQFAAVTRTAVGVANFYVNGEASGTADQDSGTPAAATTNLYIGCRSDDAVTFEGTIGEVFVHNRVLTPQEIQRNYLATKWRYR